MHALRWPLIALLLVSWPAAPVFSAAVATQTITAPPNTDDSGAEVPPDAPPDTNVAPDGDDSDTPDDTTTPTAVAPEELPSIEYDFDKLPPPVKRLREQIIEAAATGDPEKLRVIIDAQSEPPDFGPSDTGDPIGYLKLQSGDSEGREILAILTEVLEAGYVHVDVGTPDEVYLWPYFARYPIDKLTPPQLVQLFKLVYAGDYEDMLSNGVYDYFRAGISPDGEWKFFTAGD
jgi:hypothetical protein